MTPPWKKHETQHFYDNIRAFGRAVGTSEARAWRKRYFDAVAQKAVSQNARGVALPPALNVPSGQRLPGIPPREQLAEETEPAAPAGLSQKPTVEVTTFDSGTIVLQGCRYGGHEGSFASTEGGSPHLRKGAGMPLFPEAFRGSDGKTGATGICGAWSSPRWRRRRNRRDRSTGELFSSLGNVTRATRMRSRARLVKRLFGISPGCPPRQVRSRPGR